MYKALGMLAMSGSLIAQGDHATPQDGESDLPCAPFAVMNKSLTQHYHEKATSRGLEINGRLFMIYKSDGGATWTAVTIGTAGMACVMAIGKAWEDEDERTSL
jgi:hypothetical protein